MEPTCPVCHVSVRPTDFYCYNCGHNFKPSPLSTTNQTQIELYLKSFFLPPMGIIWGMRYLRQEDQKSKIVGWTAIGLTVIMLILVVVEVRNLVSTVNGQMNQFQSTGGF